MPKEEIEHIFIILFFIAMLVVGTMLFLFITFTNRKNKLIKAQLETKLSNQKRQYELQLNALRAQMNPHFVHNSLNAIQYYIQLNEVEKSEDYLAKFSKLMRQFFEYSRKQNISIEHEIKLLKNYLDIEKLRFEDKFDYKITIDKTLDLQDLFLPPMILQPIVENAINHGIFHKKDNGLLEINFENIQNNQFKIEIIDNGIGINESKKLSKEKNETYTEHSGFVLEERLALLKESSYWKIDFSIVDRLENENQSGTRVTLLVNLETNTANHDH